MSVQDMLEYDPDRPCPKCGTRHSTTQYLSEYRPKPQQRELPSGALQAFGIDPFRIDERAWLHPHCEHLRRTCQHCGYEWAEACIAGNA